MRQLDFNIFDTDIPVIQPSKGKILIAEPFLKGPYFSRSIVLLTEYGKQGAVGFVLNKPSNVYPDEVIDDLTTFKGELFIGGPVASDTLHFIHTLGEKLPGSVQITENIYWSGDFDTLKDFINNDIANYKHVKFFAGYSGWSPGQLEAEIKEKSWIVTEVNDAVIMDDNIDNVWEQILNGLGGFYKNWTKFPNDPNQN